MLVAVAVLLVIMSGLTMLFSGSIRTVRSAAVQSDAIDRANGAMSSLKSDILVSFNGRDYGRDFSFYGTPMGMTFIGRVKNRSENINPNTDNPVLKETDLRVARITYVLYHDENSFQTFPEAIDGQPAYTHRLLRYVEPNVADVESFPFPMDAFVEGQPQISDFIQAQWDEFSGGSEEFSAEYKEKFEQAAKCELWIRMLAGGDAQVPNAWAAPAVYLGRDDIDPYIGVLDFVLTDHVATFVAPNGDFGYNNFPFSGGALFDYNYARPDLSVVGPNGWWNDRRSLNCRGGSGFCLETGLPEVVSLNFWLMFEGTHAGAANYQRLFSMTVNLPAGYKRQPTIAGHVYSVSNNDQAIPDVLITPSTDLGIIIKTDTTGYYCATVPYGWSGTMSCAQNNEIKSYTNVTTNITGQDYAVQ